MQDALFKAQSSAGHVPKFAELLRFSVRSPRCGYIIHDHCRVCRLQQRRSACAPDRPFVVPCYASLSITPHALPLQNLSVGAKLWGSVQEVTHKRLIIQLPHGLRGFVAPLDASDVLRSLLTDAPSKADKRLRGVLHGAVPTLPDLFYPGQFVRAAVSRLDDGQDDGNAPAASKVRTHGRACVLWRHHITHLDAALLASWRHAQLVVRAVHTPRCAGRQGPRSQGQAWQEGASVAVPR